MYVQRSGQPGVGTISMSQTPSSKRKLLTIVIGTIVITIVFIVGIFIFTNLATSAPQKVSDQFVSLLQKNDAPVAYSLGSTDFKGSITTSDLQKMFERLSPLMSGEPKIIGKKIFRSTSVGKIAIFVYRISGTNNQKYYLKIELKNENSEWKILNMRSSENLLDATIE